MYLQQGVGNKAARIRQIKLSTRGLNAPTSNVDQSQNRRNPGEGIRIGLNHLPPIEILHGMGAG